MSNDDAGKATRRYLEGLAHGREAASLLPDAAPLSAEQKAWLSGFLSGLFGRSEAAEPRLNPLRATLRDTPPQPAAAMKLDRRPEPLQLRSPRSQTYHRDNPYAARLLRIEASPASGNVESYRVVVDVEGSGIEFAAGDRVGVRRQTDPDKVRDVLRRLSARGQEPVPSREGTAPAWRVLLEEVDIERPTSELVLLLARSARDRDERATLEADAGATRDGLNVAGYLRRFPSARPELAELVRSLRPIEPTVHSVARSRLAGENAIELFVPPSFPSSRDKRRDVPCAVFADLAAGRIHRGDWLPIYVIERSALRLPTDPGAPAIFIGAGVSDVATIHSLLDERALTKATGRNWVFAPVRSEAAAFHGAFENWLASRLVTRYDAVTGGAAELAERLSQQKDMLARWFVDGAVVYVTAPEAELERIVRVLVTIFGETSLSAADADGPRLRLADVPQAG
jgi:sulfite reductase (NADPH) flavoprotein alpha-component